MLMGCLPAMAQRRLVVADIETLQPVAGANVQAMGTVTATDSAGLFSVADSCRSIVVSHVNYESRLLNLSELGGDTVFIISKLLNVKEVVVFGRGRADEDEQLQQLRRSLRMSRTEAQLAAANPNQGFNILGLVKYLIPKKWRKRESRKQKLQRVLDEY
jgi:hypothetical protein